MKDKNGLEIPKNGIILAKDCKEPPCTKIKLQEGCKPDGYVHASYRKLNPKNLVAYGDISKRGKKTGSLKGLAKDIDDNGLMDPAKIYNGSTMYEAGHNRDYALLEILKEEWIPFIWVKVPKDELEELLRILASNVRHITEEYEKYETALMVIKQKKKQEPNISRPKLKKFINKVACPLSNLAPDTFKDIEYIHEHRPSMYKKYKKGGIALSVAKKSVKSDLNPRGYNLKPVKYWDNFFTESDVEEIWKSVHRAADKFFNIPSTIKGKEYELTKNYDEGTISNFIHDTFSHIMVKYVIDHHRFKNYIKSGVYNSQNIFDNYIQNPNLKDNKKMPTEVKTILLKKGVSLVFKSKRKSGYHWFIIRDFEADRVYICFAHVKQTDWDQAGKDGKLTLKNIYNLKNKTEFVGQIKKTTKENHDDTYQVYLDKINE